MRFSITTLVVISLSLTSVESHAQSQATPEQQRLALIAKFQKLSDSADAKIWRARAHQASQAGETVQAIPFNIENATNSADVIAIGKKIWDSKFKNGKTLASCFVSNGKRAAASYPQFDPKNNRVVTLNQAINDCLDKHGERRFALESQQLAAVSAFLKSLASSQRVAIKVPAGYAVDAFELGRAIFSRRMGQQDMACASCHVIAAAEQFNQAGVMHEQKKQYLSPLIGLAIERPILERGGQIKTLQRQFQICMARVGAEPYQIGSDDMNQLEYFVSYMSNNFALE